MKKYHYWLAAALVLIAGTAFSQTVGNGPPAASASFPSTYPGARTGYNGMYTAKSYTTTSAALFAAATAGANRQMVFFKNQGSTVATLCPNSVASPAVGAAGCIDVPAGGTADLCSQTACPNDAWNIVGGAAGNGTLGLQ